MKVTVELQGKQVEVELPSGSTVKDALAARYRKMNEYPKNVTSLRVFGWDVKIKHLRRYVTPLGEIRFDEHHIRRRYGWVPLATGGVTIMSLCRGHVSVAVEANCHPKDNYCKKIGVAMCLERLPAFVWE